MEQAAITGHYVQVSGTRTYYESCGKGTPVLCLHPAGCDGRVFRYVLPLLAEAGLQAIALDLPGHGKSYPVDWRPFSSIHDFAEFVLAFARQAGLEMPVLLGCSVGGDIAIDLAVNHSADLRACVVLAAAARTTASRANTSGDISVFAENHTAMGWEAIAEMVAPSSFRVDSPPDLIEEARWLQKGAPQVVRACDLIGWDRHDVRSRLHQVSIPLLVCLGTGDYHVPEHLVDETVAGTRWATKRLLSGLGHIPVLEDPEHVCGVVLEYLHSHGIR